MQVGPAKRATGSGSYPARMSNLLYRLFRIGKMPKAMRETADSELAICEAEGIGVVISRRGKGPGFRASASKSWSSGAFAVTPRRVLGSIGSTKIVDVPFDVGGASNPASLDLREDGLHVNVDMSAMAVPGVEGQMSFHFRAPLGTEGPRSVSGNVAVVPSVDGRRRAHLRWPSEAVTRPGLTAQAPR